MWKNALKRLAEVDADKGLPSVTGLMGRRYLYEECRKLKAKNILEIGTHMGYTSLVLALAAEYEDGHVTTVDNSPRHKDHAVALAQGAGLENRITFVTNKTSIEYLSRTPKTFDVAFIDGGHGEENVLSELCVLRHKMNTSGVIFLHDVFPPDELARPGERLIPGPWRAVDRFMDFAPDMKFEFVRTYKGEIIRMGRITL